MLWLELITKFKATCTPAPSFTLPLVVKRGGVEKGGYPVNLWGFRNLSIINEPIYKAAVEEFVNVFKHFWAELIFNFSVLWLSRALHLGINSLEKQIIARRILLVFLLTASSYEVQGLLQDMKKKEFTLWL
ncbi:hypothetical protein SLA2020_097250 [Shorea laevis]